MRKLFAVVLALALLVLPSLAAEITPSQWVEQVAYPATLELVAQDWMGDEHIICTATAIGKGAKDIYRFVTAAHCVLSDDMKSLSEYRLRAKIDAADMSVTVDIKLIAIGKPDEGWDFALFDAEIPIPLQIVPLGVNPKGFEEVANVSVPLGFGKQVFRGSITQPSVNRKMEGKDVNWTGAVLVQIPGLAPASSGSLVLCLDQRAACALFVGTLRNKMEVAIPISKLREFIEATAKK